MLQIAEVLSTIVAAGVLTAGCLQARRAGQDEFGREGTATPDEAGAPASPAGLFATAAFELPNGGPFSGLRLYASKDGTSIAVVGHSAQGYWVIQDGRQHPGLFEDVIGEGFSQDGETFAYLGLIEGRWQLVVNGDSQTEGALPLFPKTENLRPPELIRSPVHAGFAIAGWSRFGWRVVRWGRVVGMDYDGTSQPVFSPDGESLAFVAHTGRKQLVVGGGFPLPGLYDQVKELRYSPDGRSLLFIAERERKQFVVRDGAQISRDYDNCDQLVLSPSGRSLAFVARTHGSAFVVRDGRRIGGRYKGADYLCFSPDGHSLAFVAHVGVEVPEAAFLVVKDGVQVGGTYNWRTIGGPIWSPDGRSLVFRAQLGGENVVVKDGVQIHAEPVSVRAFPPCVSPDGRSLAFNAMTASGRWCVLKDGVRVGAEYDSAYAPFFGPDGSLFFWARASGNVFLVRDGVPVGGEYVCVSPASTYGGTERSAVTFAAIRGQTVYRVVIPLAR